MFIYFSFLSLGLPLNIQRKGKKIGENQVIGFFRQNSSTIIIRTIFPFRYIPYFFTKKHSRANVESYYDIS